MMILEFNTEAEALTCLGAINNMAAAWWQSQGYTVIDNNGVFELIGKKGGFDNPNAMRTLTWDTPTQSPDNTWYIASLTGTRPEWVNWKQNLADSGFTAIGTEKEIPSTWFE